MSAPAFEAHMARVVEVILELGTDPVPGCTRCVIRDDFTACTAHVAKAAAAAVMQSWTDPVPRRSWRWWLR